MKRQGGFTLVELMVVVALITLALGAATLSFSRLNEKYTVESEIKEIYSILMQARNDTSTTNTTRLVVLGANQIQTGIDADGDNVIDGVPVTKNYPRFNITSNNGPLVAFDRRGITNNLQTIRIQGFAAGSSPALDCIAVANTRINMGVMTGGNCVQR